MNNEIKEIIVDCSKTSRTHLYRILLKRKYFKKRDFDIILSQLRIASKYWEQTQIIRVNYELGVIELYEGNAEFWWDEKPFIRYKYINREA